MIKDPNSDANKISVFLIDGRQFTNKDVPSAPFGEGNCFNVVSFWYDKDILMIFPMSLVEHVEIHA